MDDELVGKETVTNEDYWAWIIATMPDGKWRIPADVIAHSRSHYYATIDVERGDAPDYDTAYNREYRYAMTDEVELIDWASNNMDWSEVKDKVERVPEKTAEIDYDREWTNAEKVLQQ